MEKMYRAVKYIRTSCSDNETQYSDSVANQRRLIDAFISTQPEIIIVSEKVDDGYSGLFTERPAFKELLADIETGAINCVIVKDLSRLSRDYIETGRYLRDYFPAHGVRFISVDDNIDSAQSDGFDKTIALLKSIFNEQYCRDVSIKTRASLDIKRRQGKYVGAIPIYGYQKSIEDKHQLVPDPNTVDVVKSIFHMKLSGLSAAAISIELDKLNIPSPLTYRRKRRISQPAGGFSDRSNVRWSISTVLRILKDENYTGTLVQGGQHYLNYKSKILVNSDESEWVKIENAHLALISRADYEAVQRILATDTRTAPKRDKVHTFSGLLICGCCGSNMTRKTVPHKEKRYVYYYCPTGKRNGCHSSGTINEELLICIVIRKIRERITDIERLYVCISQSQIGKLMRIERNQQASKLNMRISDMQKYRLHIHNIQDEHFISDVERQELKEFYSAEISRLDAELSALWKESLCAGASIANSSGWDEIFLKFSCINELDRLAVVKMIRSIRVFATKEIIIDFVYQPEYEQLIRYADIASGGSSHGEKEPETE